MKYAFANFLLFAGVIALLGLVALGCAMLERAAFVPIVPTPVAFPTQNGPLLLPPQLCPSPWPIYPGAAKPRSTA